uniref:DDE Tnp4 domain-containing protein n=1 Tax=Timema cristinae TaxID=61476 RepID=A0A7R9GQA6_TIMCR|nr:unnamed protein product [Timema cristinae]
MKIKSMWDGFLPIKEQIKDEFNTSDYEDEIMNTKMKFYDSSLKRNESNQYYYTPENNSQIKLDEQSSSRVVVAVGTMQWFKRTHSFPGVVVAVGTMQWFKRARGFPGVVAAVDGTHIAILSPRGGVEGFFWETMATYAYHIVLTLLLNARTEAEQRYNAAHIAAHNPVERLFGLWKLHFRCGTA